MSFIGMISDHKCFEKLNQEINDRFKNSIKLIHINKNSISNVKNIKFDAVIIEEDLKKFEKETMLIDKICNKANYIVINTDVNADIKLKGKIITYGCNHNAMITISSVTDTDILICLQKEIKNKKGKLIEIGEKHIKIKENSNLKIEDFLIIASIFLVKNYSIIEEI